MEQICQLRNNEMILPVMKVVLPITAKLIHV